MKTILFQGDSITDANRSRDNAAYRGSGYATLVTAELGYRRPKEFRFINLGISGNKTLDLLVRLRRDIIDQKPDYLSILIGVNDVLHEYDTPKNGIAARWSEVYYDLLLTQLRAALPDTHVMLLEPFVLRGTWTDEHYDSSFRREVEKRAAITRALAEKHGCAFVPLQETLDKLAKETGDPSYWLMDGIHPTAMGHEVIKREWLRTFESL